MSCRRNSLLIGLLLLAPWVAAAAPSLKLYPPKPQLGTVCLLELKGPRLEQVVGRVTPSKASSAEIQLIEGERRVTFVQAGPDRWLGLLGIDLEDPTGAWEIEMIWLDATKPGVQRQKFPVSVQTKAYAVQKLKLPPSKVDLDAEGLKRVERESAEVDALWPHRGPLRKLGPIVHPLTTKPPGDRFGSRRIINGEAKAQHSGADYKAKSGTPVRSMAAGTVVLAADHFFAGRSVFVDHGGGWISMYFHLNSIGVRQGQVLEAGDKVGTVGATGRVTGPHLHFGIRLNGARVDPDSLLSLAGLL